MDVSKLQVSEHVRNKIAKGIEIMKNCFGARANDGKIVLADVTPVFVAIMEEYKQVEILQDELEKNEGIKKHLDSLVEKNDLDKDGFLDWTEYMTLVMDARSTYTEELFTKFDLNGDGEIDKEEMEAVVASIKESGNELKANEMRENFDVMLKNFDANGDGKISISEYVNSLKNIKNFDANGDG